MQLNTRSSLLDRSNLPCLTYAHTTTTARIRPRLNIINSRNALTKFNSRGEKRSRVGVNSKNPIVYLRVMQHFARRLKQAVLVRDFEVLL